MSQEPTGAKPKNYIHRLQEEREELQARIRELETQSGKVVHEAKFDPQDTEDDRNDLIDIVYGPTLREYKYETLPKWQAVQRLVDYYQNLSPTARNVPKTGKDGKNVNHAPVYARIERRDPFSGETSVYLKDLPIWIMVDRIINGTNQYRRVELISKKEWLEDQTRAARAERDWAKERREKKLEAAADLILEAGKLE